MRCDSCNVILSLEEQKRKSEVTGDYFFLCNTCLGDIATDIPDSIPEDDPIWDEIIALDDISGGL